MKPFPKWFGGAGAILALVQSIYLGITTGDWTTLAAAVGAVMALFSHSLTGTGGKPPAP